MQDNYKNYAFISYKREDEKWAKWLQHKLESYKLPSVIRKESFNMPKYIRPVFRDKTDLSGGVLTTQLHNELERSKYLIVICSPNSAQSVWVNKEAATFIEEGRTEYIIPFIVAGTPHAANAADECFPEVLRTIPSEQELLGINVQEIGREKAFIRLAAYMIGVSFDTLWQRHRRQEKRKKMALAICALLFMGLGIFFWDYTRATYEYYADYVDCWGVPKGVIELAPEQVSHRHRCYQFEYRRIPFGEPHAYDWRLAKVSYVNSAGTPQEHSDTELLDRNSVLLLEYSKKTGTILRINQCNSFGKVLLRFDILGRDNIPASIVDIKGSFEEAERGFAPSKTTSYYGLASKSSYDSNKSNIKRYAYLRDENGYIIRQTYHNSNLRDLSKSRTWDSDGVSGMSFTLDSLGRRIRIQYLDENNQYISIDNGVAGKIMEYDEKGVMSKVAYVDVDCEPILNEYLWAIGITVSNDDGNILREHIYDEKGVPCMNKFGVSIIAYDYNEQGEIIGELYFAPDSTPCYHKTTRIFWREYEYDSRGNKVSERFWDEKGNACYSSEGYAMRKMKYNKSGKVTKAEYFDIYGRPNLIGDGSMVTYEYDSSGNMLTESFRNFLGGCSVDIYGVHQYGIVLDSLDNVERKYFLDTEHQLYEHPNYGYATIKYIYDSWGNKVGETYLDANGNPCLAKETNVAGIQWVLDENSNVIEEAYLGIDGTLCLDKYGSAVYVSERDNKGRAIKRYSLDENRKPHVDKQGIFYNTFEYDSKSNLVEIALFDDKGHLHECANGHAILRRKFDDRGNLIEETYYNKYGLPCKNVDGYAKVSIAYDNRDNMIEITYFDENGSMCSAIDDGWARTTYKHDAYGNCIETAYWDTYGKLCMHKERNVARFTTTFDRRGNIIEQAYFNKEGLPCMPTGEFARWTYEYNDWGIATRYTQYDDNGKVVLDSVYEPMVNFIINSRDTLSFKIN